MLEVKALRYRREGAGRSVVNILLSALLCSAAALAVVPTAQAFEIFGIKLFGSSEEDEQDIVDPLNYTVTLVVTDGDEDLREKLEKASSLVSDADRPVSGSLGLLAKARGDREQLVAALYTEARYGGLVDISIAGQKLDDLPPDAEFSRTGPVPVAITITPGPVFTLGRISLEGDAADIAPAQFGLVPGGDAGSDAILKAEAGIVRALKEEGRPLAAITGRDIVADQATSRLDVSLTVAAGPVAGYGATTVDGTEGVDRGFTEYMTGLVRGRKYSPKEIDDARARLQALGVFSSVTVKEAAALDQNGEIPIHVEVSERKFRYYGVGATVSSTEGLGLEGYWGHRNLFGHAEKLRFDGSIGQIGDSTNLGGLNYSAGVMFEKPGVLGPDSKFFAGSRLMFEHPDAYDMSSVEANVGIAYELSETQSVSAELAIAYSDIEDVFNPEGERHLPVSIPLQYIFDNRDNRLDPKSGFRAVAFMEPTYDILTSAAFVKFRGDASAYKALDAASKFVVAGRVATGSIIGASLEDIPADRRFYAGGGGSVRGYAYQGIGPKENGTPTGGRSLIETSVEMRMAINDTFGVVSFVDGASVSQGEAPDFSGFKVGAGVGIRYLTPFGPLRVDVAVPLNPDPGDPDYGIYAGIGQAF